MNLMAFDKRLPRICLSLTSSLMKARGVACAIEHESEIDFCRALVITNAIVESMNGSVTISLCVCLK